jgi:hypothetical protein
MTKRRDPWDWMLPGCLVAILLVAAILGGIVYIAQIASYLSLQGGG